MMKRREHFATDNLICIGEVIKTRGLRGELKVIIYSGSPVNLLNQSEVILLDAEGQARSLQLVRARAHKRAFLVQFEDCDSVAQAQSLVGARVMIAKSSLKELDDDEFYWFEIIGMDVFDRDGKSYGRVSRILETGSNDVYISVDGDREYYIPAVKEIVIEVNRQTKSILIEPPEGLFGDD